MELLLVFFPSIISLYIYFTIYRKEKNSFNLLILYSIFVITNNTIILLLSKLWFRIKSYLFTTSFSLKYLFISLILSLILPTIMVKPISKISEIIKVILTSTNNRNKYIQILKVLNFKKYFFIFLYIIVNMILLLGMDLLVRAKSTEIVEFYPILKGCPNILTLTYIIIFCLLTLKLPKIISRILYILNYVFVFLIFLINYFLVVIKSKVFTIYDISNIDEALPFLNFVHKTLSLKLVLGIIFIIIFIIINYLNLIKINRIQKYKLNKIIVIFLLALIIFLLGNIRAIAPLDNYNKESWEANTYPKYFYDNVKEPTKSLQVCGLYNYTLKDFYFYLINNNSKVGSISEIEKTTSIKTINKNDMTGIFKNKNLIIIMMESIDNVVVDEKTMPTLYKMQNEGLNFTNRYSALASGGSTISTEFSSLSGLYYNPEYSHNILINSYNESLPSIFNEIGYVTNSSHENNGKYYDRDILHKSLGFKNSYFLYDILDKPEYFMDDQFVTNDSIYQKLFPKNKKFMTFITTLSAHGPYDKTNINCYQENENFTELECFRYLAKRTDNLLKELIKKLKDEKRLDDTVIVVYTDHQAYQYNYPAEYLETLNKIDDNYNIKTIPFTIYNSKIKHKEIGTLVNDIDMLPTILNLFGIKYNENYYIGKDIFSKNHKDLVYFLDYTWYDGEKYSGNIKTFNKEDKTNSEITFNLFHLNDSILTNNYYKKKKDN